MGMFRFSKTLYLPGIFSLVFLIWAHSAFASALSIEYSLGFNNRFQINKWTPITVTLENRGKAVSGTLEVLVTSGSEYHRNVYQATYSLDLDLPYGSRKQCSFTVLIESFTHDLIIRYQRGGDTIASQSINLRTFYTQKHLACVLIEGIYPEVIPALPQFLSSVHLNERFLPETWYGYDGVKLLIMEAGKVNRLRPSQLTALESWVRQGGFLVVSGSINAGVLMDRGVQRLLPITVNGLKEFDRLRSLPEFSGLETVNLDPFLVLQVDIRDSQVLSTEGNIPLVIDYQLGNGKIVFLSFDPHSQPFSRLMSYPGFWDKIMAVSPKSDPKPMIMPVQRILQVMLASINMRFPGYWFSAFSVLLYLVLLWICVRQVKNNKWKSVSYLCLTIIGFAFAGIGYSLSFSQNYASYNSFCRINLTEKSAHLDGEYILGLYSTGEKPYEFSFPETAMPVSHVIFDNSTQKIPNPFRIKQVGRRNHIVGVSGNWSFSFYKTRPLFEFPIFADVQSDGDHLNVIVENQTPYEMVDCWIFYNQRFFKIKDIAAESNESRNIAKSLIEGEPVYDAGGLKSKNIRGTQMESTFFETIQNNLKEDLRVTIHRSVDANVNEKTVYLMGWINADIIKPNFFQKDITGKGVTLVTWKGKI